MVKEFSDKDSVKNKYIQENTDATKDNEAQDYSDKAYSINDSQGKGNEDNSYDDQNNDSEDYLENEDDVEERVSEKKEKRKNNDEDEKEEENNEEKDDEENDDENKSNNKVKHSKENKSLHKQEPHKKNNNHKNHHHTNKNKVEVDDEGKKKHNHISKHKEDIKDNKKAHDKGSHKKSSEEDESDDDESYSFSFEDDQGEDSNYRISAKTLLISVIAIIAIIALIFGFIYLNKNSKEKQAAKELEEQNRPAKIQITLITNPSCTDCVNLNDIVSELKFKYNITEEISLDYSDGKAKNMINNYQIKKIPTVVVQGELEKAGTIDGFESVGSVLVYSGTIPPYTDAITGDILGKVSVVLITNPFCTDCVNLTAGIEEIKTMASVISEQTYSSSSSMGSELISRYNIKKLPSIIMSKDIKAYEFANLLEGVGTYEADGSFVLRNVSPPYFDVSQNKIIGLVSMTYITDKSCSNCYNVSEHKEIVKSMGMKIVSESTYDISDNDGINLRSKYNITQVPTVILSSEAGEYPSFKQIWPDVGTQESDGSYILRKASVMGTYRDLSTNQVVNGATTP